MPHVLMNQSLHLAPFKKIYMFVFATILTLPSFRFDTMYVDNYDTFNIYGAEMELATISEMPILGTIDWWKKGQNSLVTHFNNMATSTK